MARLVFHDGHSADGRGRGAAQLDGQGAESETGRLRHLIQVDEILDMVILALPHDPVGFPQFAPLEHVVDRRIEADGVDAHEHDPLIQQPVDALLGHAGMVLQVVGTLPLLGGVRAQQDNVQRLDRVADAVQGPSQILH